MRPGVCECPLRWGAGSLLPFSLSALRSPPSVWRPDTGLPPGSQTGDLPRSLSLGQSLTPAPASSPEACPAGTPQPGAERTQDTHRSFLDLPRPAAQATQPEGHRLPLPTHRQQSMTQRFSSGEGPHSTHSTHSRLHAQPLPPPGQDAPEPALPGPSTPRPPRGSGYRLGFISGGGAGSKDTTGRRSPLRSRTGSCPGAHAPAPGPGPAPSPWDPPGPSLRPTLLQPGRCSDPHPASPGAHCGSCPPGLPPRGCPPPAPPSRPRTQGAGRCSGTLAVTGLRRRQGPPHPPASGRGWARLPGPIWGMTEAGRALLGCHVPLFFLI